MKRRRLKKIADSYYGEWRDKLKLKTTRKQDDACLQLERWGKRFLVDFGYENAEWKLEELFSERLLEVAGMFH